MNDNNYLLVIILYILYNYFFLQFLRIAALCNYVIIANQIKHGLLLLLHYFRNIKKQIKLLIYIIFLIKYFYLSSNI